MRKFIDIVTASPVSPPPVSSFELFEAAKAFDQMMESTITFLNKLGEVIEYDQADYLACADAIRKAAKELGNGRNLATWFTRWARAGLVASLNKYFQTRARDSNQFGDGSFATPEILTTIEKYTAKVVQDYERQTNGKLSVKFLSELENSIGEVVEKLRHSKTVEFAPVQNYTFSNQTPVQATEELHALEQRFIERKNTTRHLTPKTEDKIVLKLDNDFAWFLLPRASCYDEKNAMSHCGNTASPRPGQQILSLREHIEGDKWIPHATFIMNADGTLGERKGFNNHKVKPAFYKYVTPLLKQPWIKGLVQGAYLSSNDFAMDWLPEAEREELYAINPNLFNIEYRYNLEGMTDEVMHLIANGVQKVGKDWYRLNGFSLDKVSEEDKAKLFTKYPFLMSVKDQYERFGVTQELADYIADGHAREGDSFYFSNKFNPKVDMTEEDRFKLWDMRPDLMSLDDRYKRFGMTEEMMNAILEGLKDGDPRDITRNFISRLSTEDRDTLYTKYPETMPPAIYYHRLGLTPELKEIVIKGAESSGIRWFKQNTFFPNVPSTPFDNYELRIAQNKTVAGEPAGCVLAPEETKALFAGHEELFKTLFPHGYYDEHGMTDSLASHVRDRAVYQGYHVANRELPFAQLKPEDHNALLDKYPELHSVKDYYRRFGMNDALEKWLVALDQEGLDAANDHYPEGHNWARTDYSFDIRTDLSDEDREKLFADHPLMMTLDEHYERRGMDKLFLNIIKDGYDSDGSGFLRDLDIDLDKVLKPEDREKLMKKHPEYFSFTVQLAEMKPERFLQSVSKESDRLQDTPWPYNYDLALDESKQNIYVAEFSDMNEIIEELGSSELQHYGGEDYDADYDPWDGDGDVGQMENIIPWVMRQKIMEYSKATYGSEESEQDEDDDDDDDYGSGDSTDWDDWDEVVEALNDNGDSIYDAMQNAITEGNRVGHTSEVHEAVCNAVEHVETKYGHLVYQHRKDEDGKDHISWEGPIYYAFSLAEMAKFLDEETNSDGYCNYNAMKELLKDDEIEFRERDFYGFDDDAALERFTEEVDHDIFKGAPVNPYRPLKNGRRAWEVVPREKMIEEIKAIYARAPERKFPRWSPKSTWDGRANNNRGAYVPFGPKTIEELDDEELTKVFRAAVEEAYIPY